jgi:hypothetical protein
MRKFQFWNTAFVGNFQLSLTVSKKDSNKGGQSIEGEFQNLKFLIFHPILQLFTMEYFIVINNIIFYCSKDQGVAMVVIIHNVIDYNEIFYGKLLHFFPE